MKRCEKLYQLRQQSGMTLQQAAQKSGLSAATLQRLEAYSCPRTRKDIRASTITAIAKLYGITVAELLRCEL